jgi:hypothetical protein
VSKEIQIALRKISPITDFFLFGFHTARQLNMAQPSASEPDGGERLHWAVWSAIASAANAAAGKDRCTCGR